jgi:hypothetical protein
VTISVTQDDVFTAMRNFLRNILPADVEVVRAPVNRVPEPVGDNYVMMIPLRRERIETNVDSWSDQAWVGSIAGTIMTVTKLLAGTITEGAAPSASSPLSTGTIVGSQISGTPGGLGTYNVSPSQSVAGGTIFQAGAGTYLQPTKVTLQLDFHGPSSADNAQIVSTMLRDEYGVSFFGQSDQPGAAGTIIPLYADDPRYLAFNNDQQQVEERWVLEALLQVNASNLAAQQFADAVSVTPINVDVTYPPSN